MLIEKRKPTRRLYLAMTSLALITGAALGHWSGKQGTLDSFVQDCSESHVSVVYDRVLDQHRHFHCFEIDAQAESESEQSVASEEVFVL